MSYMDAITQQANAFKTVDANTGMSGAYGNGGTDPMAAIYSMLSGMGGGSNTTYNIGQGGGSGGGLDIAALMAALKGAGNQDIPGPVDPNIAYQVNQHNNPFTNPAGGFSGNGGVYQNPNIGSTVANNPQGGGWGSSSGSSGSGGGWAGTSSTSINSHPW